MTWSDLTDTQRNAMLRLKDGRLHSASDLGAPSVSLRKLVKDGLVLIHVENTHVTWRITNAGMALMKNMEAKRL